MNAAARSVAREMRRDPLRRAFERMAAKGGCARPSSLESAHKAREVIDHLLSEEERSDLGSAKSHVTADGCSREEWDDVCARIRARLWPRSS